MPCAIIADTTRSAMPVAASPAPRNSSRCSLNLPPLTRNAENRPATPGMDAGNGGAERQLADGNAHAVGAEIAEPQNALAVGDDDQFGAIGPVLQNLGDVAAFFRGNEHAARTLEDQSVFLAGKPHRRRVDDRLDLV